MPRSATSLRTLLRAGLKTLTERAVPSAELAAELILAYLVGCDRGYLHTHPEAQISPELATRYGELIGERASGKPTQYITGHQEFWGLDFEVTPDVLIPRPETEHVVEAVLECAGASSLGRQAPFRIVDVGTGSGAIAISLAAELPMAAIFATDLSCAALRVAAHNARRLGLERRVHFCQMDLLSGFGPNPRARFDFVLSNPPYVGIDELDQVQREVRDFEPRLAWGGVEHSGAIYQRLFEQASALLNDGGYIIVEIGYRMSESVSALLAQGWTGVQVRPDLAGMPRVIAARKRTQALGRFSEGV
jgi:release factor glutamine methyltransferase